MNDGPDGAVLMGFAWMMAVSQAGDFDADPSAMGRLSMAALRLTECAFRRQGLISDRRSTNQSSAA